MPVQTRSKARSTQPVDREASAVGSITPRRVLRSRQGDAGLIVNIAGWGSPAFIVREGPGPNHYSITKCGSARCETCKSLKLSKTVKSNCTHREYSVINHTNENLNCHSQNTVYLLTCKCCNLQYVGETATPLHIRMNNHRGGIGNCEHMINHSQNTCKGHQFIYQILEKLPGTGYDQFGDLDLEVAKTRREKEEIWMKKLRTIYPYGLNEKAKGKDTNASQITHAVGRLFPPLARHGDRQCRTRLSRNEKQSVLSCDAFFAKLDNLIHNDIKQSFNQIRTILNNVKKKVLKEIAFYILERDKYTFIDKYEQWYLYTLDIIDTKLYKEKPPRSDKIKPENVFVLRFVNKGMNELHLSSIFRSQDVKELLPEALNAEKDIPTIAMKLDTPTRNKIFNYKQTVQDLNIQIDEEVSFLQNQFICNCDNSEFCDPHHKHIITGNLNIINNLKLRKLLSKGPNYRESKPLNYKACRKTITETIDKNIETLAEKYNVNKTDFKAWRDKILSKVDTRINQVKRRRYPQPCKPALKDEEVLRELQLLHDKFVLVPIDKASNNIAIICKQFYVKKVLSEVGGSGDPSDTYELIGTENENVIERTLDMCKRFGLDTTEKDKALPYMYWMPKMHYQPSRARFIVASSTCSNKPMARLSSTIFKHLFKQMESFHHHSTFYANYNRFWVIQNSTPLIEKLDKINRRKSAKDISTYDFSTLYTKLPHTDLLRILNKIIDKTFKGGKNKNEINKKFLTINGERSYWTRKKHGKNSYKIDEVKLLMKELITKSYFQVGNLVFRQRIGIPMGIDPAPFWANLYLYDYECEFITEMMKSNKPRAHKFRHATRFIDDECNLNDGGEFGRSHHQIYPEQLTLKCEHHGTHATFLELDISVKDGVFVYKLFDKRDDYPFFIVRMPDLSGNIPSHVFYGSVMSEFLRIARATLLYKDFLPRAASLYHRMVSQGGSEPQILKQISKAVFRHSEPFTKFHKHARTIISDIKKHQ